MKELSNKTIFAILAVTLIIALTGTFVNMGRIYGIEYLGLTGAATAADSGNATITISQSTSITNNFDFIQFGAGFVNSSCTVCVMDTNGIITAACCGTFNQSNNLGFLLENTGNVNLSVNYTCTGSCAAAEFIGGTNPAFQIRATNNSFATQAGEISAADTLGSCNNDLFRGFNITNYSVSVAASGHWLCGNGSVFPLDFTDNQDAFVVDLNVSVPSDAPTAAIRNATFVFNALATG
ncbi:MAG: hypothetical protein AABY40_00555 [Nanoarchaeota archaeon]